MIFADLHCHSAYSDGIHSLEDIAKMHADSGVKVVAITDHDTVFHQKEVKEAMNKYGIESINGVEMSCYDFDVNKKVHVVGLWLKDNPEHVDSLCRKTLQARDNYHKKLIKILNDKGLEITYEDAKKYSPYNIVFKMHLFMALVEKYPEYKNMDKYRELFASKTSLETDREMGYIDVKEGIEAIHKDGGIAILAHPCEYGNYPEIEKYVGYNLDGIEISHPSMKENDYPLTREYCDKYSLARSGGTDFHSNLLQNSAFDKYGLEYDQYLDLLNYKNSKIKF